MKKNVLQNHFLHSCMLHKKSPIVLWYKMLIVMLQFVECLNWCPPMFVIIVGLLLSYFAINSMKKTSIFKEFQHAPSSWSSSKVLLDWIFKALGAMNFCSLKGWRFICISSTFSLFECSKTKVNAQEVLKLTYQKNLIQNGKLLTLNFLKHCYFSTKASYKEMIIRNLDQYDFMNNSISKLIILVICE
jgi:hypothetical protein